ncbi:acylphosphatase [Paratractidigestivibacter faecalis]|uniref:acylphosphatase n=1 Tax=Paratractidigestivibacter faecalis TaxID=2292441 RepID=UPI003AB7492B
MQAGDGALRRTRYRFVGQVQGVGFRWTSSRIASGLGLTGWVRNEYDGSVTCVLQGTDAQIGAFFSQLADMMHRYAHYAIDSRKDEGVVAGERDFRVRY